MCNPGTLVQPLDTRSRVSFPCGRMCVQKINAYPRHTHTVFVYPCFCAFRVLCLLIMLLILLRKVYGVADTKEF